MHNPVKRRSGKIAKPLAADGSEEPLPAPPACKWSLPFCYSLAIAALIIVSFALVMFLLRNDLEAKTAFSDLALIPLNGIVSLVLLYAAVCTYLYGKNFYNAWLIFSLATLSFTIGDIIWTYEEVILGRDPFGSIADFFYLAYYPLFLIGILSLPSLKFSLKERVKMMLDIGIVMIAAIIIFWSLIIGPAIQNAANEDLLTLILYIIYPAWDLVLIFSVMELLFKKIYGNEKTPLFFLAAGMITLIITDSIYLHQSFLEIYVAGGLLDLGWPIAYVLVGLAGMSQANSLVSGTFKSSEDLQPRHGELTWPLYLPYLCAAGAFLLLIWSHENPIGLSFTTLSRAVAIIIGLVILRQILVLNENAQLYKKAQEDIRQRELARSEVVRLNEELEGRVAQRTLELETANKELQCEVLERIQAEAAMQDSERRMADIINFLPDATFVVNKKGEIIAWNRAIENMTGVRAEEILGKGNYEYALPFYGRKRPILIDLVLNPDLDVKGCYEDLKRHEDNSLVGICFTTCLKGRMTYLMGSAAVLCNSEGNVYGAIESIRDITEQKIAEEDLKNALERAESATRSKSKFLANMSHEIRTPMNAVIGMAGLLLESDLKPEQREYLEIIRNSGSSLLAIINDILDYSKIDGEKLELEVLPFDLTGCIEVSMDLVAAKAAEKGLELTYFQDKSVPRMIKGDEIRLRQILVNLLGNAAKFTDKGEITLTVSSTPLAGGKIELHFAVKDTGIGISEDNLSRIFQFFTQVDSATSRYYGGTGLGLAISKKLAEMMGGKIWVQSEIGVGSTFHFTIRCEPYLENDATDSEILGLAGKRVLIVEGNESVRRMLTNIIGSWGMEAVALATGEEALESIKPETIAPETIAPETIAPETIAPETIEPETIRPEMVAPETLAPETAALEIRALKAKAPKTEAVTVSAATLPPAVMQNDIFDFIILDNILPDMSGLHLARQIKARGIGSFLVMISHIGEKVERDDTLSGWLTKPVKPSLLKGLLVDIAYPPQGVLLAEDRIDVKPRASNLAILIAEDNPVNQKVAMIMLKHLNYRADVARSGRDVLASLKRKYYDVIFMDIQMPDMDGLEATRLIREMTKSQSQPYIIAMTAYALNGDREEFLGAGMNDYLSKPIQIEELKSALKRYEKYRKNKR